MNSSKIVLFVEPEYQTLVLTFNQINRFEGNLQLKQMQFSLILCMYVHIIQFFALLGSDY
jgi:hypothetical protein